MTLGFSQQWADGTPTYFIEKIWEGFGYILVTNHPEISDGDYAHYQSSHYHQFGDYFPTSSNFDISPKIHTIRKGKRWKAGMKIHPVINNRTKNRFQFAPKITCTSVQDIDIFHLKHSVEILIDGKHFASIYDLKQYQSNILLKTLAINDGFDNELEFVKYFNGDFKGQIIHWTDHKYDL